MLYTEIARKYKKSRRQMARIKKMKVEIKAQAQSEDKLDTFKLVTLRYPIIDREVYKIVKWIRLQRLPVSALIIRAQATVVAQNNLIQSFNASPGWIQKFVTRNRIQRSVKLHGSAGSVYSTHFDEPMTFVRSLIRKFNPDNVYNADETGLLY